MNIANDNDEIRYQNEMSGAPSPERLIDMCVKSETRSADGGFCRAFLPYHQHSQKIKQELKF